jgi:hypothetical protein
LTINCAAELQYDPAGNAAARDSKEFFFFSDETDA